MIPALWRLAKPETCIEVRHGSGDSSATTHHFCDVKLHFTGANLATMDQIVKGPMVQRLRPAVST